MTDFNNLQRSQAQADQVRLSYDQQRYQSHRAMDQSIMALPELQMAGKKLESDLRAQEAAIQWQHQRNKLDTMLQIDAVQQSRLQTQAMEQSLKEREFAYKEQVRAAHHTEPDAIARRIATLAPYAERLAALGGKIDLETGRMAYFTSDDEKKKYLRDISLARGGSGIAEPRLTAQYITSKYKGPMGLDLSAMSQEERDWLKRAEAGMYGNDAQAAIRAATGGGQDPGAALEDLFTGQADQAEPTSVNVGGEEITMSPLAAEQYGRAAQAASEDPHFVQMAEDMSPAGMQRLLASVAGAAEELVKAGGMPRDYAYQHVLNGFKNVEEDATVPTFFLMMSGDYDDDRIRAWLKSMGKDDKTVDAILKRSQTWAGQVQRKLERRKKQ